MTPRVTAIIGSYNNAATLERAIDSMLAQSVRELELIVIDDGSRDDSPEIARAARGGRSRACAPSRCPHNVGISRSLNRALELRAGRTSWRSRTPTTTPSPSASSASSRCSRRPRGRGRRLPDARRSTSAARELAPRTRFAAGDVGGAAALQPDPQRLRRDAPRAGARRRRLRPPLPLRDGARPVAAPRRAPPHRRARRDAGDAHDGRRERRRLAPSAPSSPRRSCARAPTRSRGGARCGAPAASCSPRISYLTPLG